MPRAKFAATLVASIAFGLVLAGVSPASAEDSTTCTTPVVDVSNDQVLDVPAVEEAVAQANGTGADFYVRVFETMPTGTVEDYWIQALNECSNWRNGSVDDLRPKSNIVLVTYSLGDREAGIKYGAGYNDAIGDSGTTEILSGMVDDLRAGNYSDAAINAVSNAAVMTDPNRPAPEPAPAPEPIDWDGFWAGVGVVMLWILGILAFVVLLVGVFFLTRSRRQLGWARRDLREARTEAGSAVVNWEGLGEFTDVMFLTNGQALPEKAQSIGYDKAVQRANGRANAATIAHGRYMNQDTHDPDKHPSRDEAESATRDFREITSQLLVATSELESLKAKALQDASHYSFEGQMDRASSFRKALNVMRGKLGDYGQLFATTVASRKWQRLDVELSAIEASLKVKSNQLDTFERLDDLDKELNELSEEFSRMQSAASSLSDPRATLRRTLENGRSRLQALAIDTSAEEKQLDRLDGEAMDNVTRKLHNSSSYDHQLGVFDSFERRVSTIIGRAQSRDDQYRAVQAKKLKKEREKMAARAAESRRRESRSSSSSDSLFGGMLGGYIGASAGSSHHSSSSSSSSSSHSSSSSDFGGGGSTSWGGGGSDFGGGGSTSW